MRTLKWISCPTCDAHKTAERLYVGMDGNAPLWLHVSYADDAYGTGWDACLYGGGNNTKVIGQFLPTAWDAKEVTHRWAIENGYMSSHERMEIVHDHAAQEE